MNDVQNMNDIQNKNDVQNMNDVQQTHSQLFKKKKFYCCTHPISSATKMAPGKKERAEVAVEHQLQHHVERFAQGAHSQ